MTMATWFETLGPSAAVLAPMLGLPLTAITFYLHSLRENVIHGQASLARRVETVESSTLELRRLMSEIPRDFTTKEEWLRELLHTRRVLEQVTEATIRLQATLDGWRPGPQKVKGTVRPEVPLQASDTLDSDRGSRTSGHPPIEPNQRIESTP